MDSPSSAEARASQAWLTPPRILGLIGLGTAAASLAWGATTYAGLPDLCAFHAMTGLPCPTCGITRSFSATAHGQLSQAFHYHAFGPFLFALMLAASLWTFTGRPFPRLQAWMVWAFAGAVFLYGLARMIGWIPRP
jgi:uncharacterized membrane protein